MTDHLINHKAQKFLGKIRIEISSLGQSAQPFNLRRLATGISRGQLVFRFIASNRLGDLEAFSQHEHQRRVDVVNTFAIARQHLIIHNVIYSRPRARFASQFCRPENYGLFRLVGASGPTACRVMRRSGELSTVVTNNVVPIHRKSEPSLQPILDLVAGGMNQVNAVILDRMQSRIPLIPELAGHLIAGGGKRLRPMLTLACAKLLEYSGDRHYKLAAAVEFIHTATLLHDDVVDGSGMRRGKRTANIIWGNPASVLVGDFLFSRSFELMVEDGSLRVLKILANASAVIAEGEVNQLTAQRQIDTSEAKYLEIIGAKTAALFSAACRISAVVAERDEKVEDALDSYGRYLGIAFQLVDDAIDYVSDEQTMGKDTGDDFRDGKITLPVILAYARGDDQARAFWKDAMEGRRVSDDDLLHAKQLLQQTDAIADTLAKARFYGQQAIDTLGAFPNGQAKAALIEAVEFAVARAF